jgi:acetyl coenzyme A synthetase (ADP forming)-like protein
VLREFICNLANSRGARPAPTLRVTYQQEAVLRDGASIVIRHAVPEDKPGLRDLFSRMSPTSISHRFFGAKRELTDADLRWLDGDDTGQAALVAINRHGNKERILGLGRYVVLAKHPDIAEVAFDVGDADQGRGIGTLLLDHLARIGRLRGITAFRAEVEADNGLMLEVFARSGFTVRQELDRDRIFHVDFPIAETDRFVLLAADRERRAAALSLRSIFAPASIAVIGASRTQNTIGRAILDNLIRDGYRGKLYPINPHAQELCGRPCFASVTGVGAPIDLAIIAVPAPEVECVLRECATAGVRGVVVITAGFAEASGDGRALEHKLRDIARAAGMRMVGPNCMGVLSTNPGVRMNATFSPVFPPTGCVSMVSQSGALGLAMLDYARTAELGIADFISIGNKTDVSVNDVLSYWHDDPNTCVIALYLESFGNPRSFARLAPQVAREKPIVAVKSGRSAAGTRAASSHSAALASLDVGIDALFAQTGVLRVDTLEQMFDVVSLLSSQPVPTGPRIGVVTNAGGPGILLADACEAHGLTLPKLTDETLAELRAILPAHAGLSNPIDMIAAAPPAHYEQVIELVGRDPNVDAVVAIYVPPLVTNPEDIAAAIARGAGTLPAHKPIATVFMSSKGTPELLSRGPRGSLPAYTFPENAALALASAVRYGTWRRKPGGSHFNLPADQEQAVRSAVRAWVAAHPEKTWLPFDEITNLLSIIGVRMASHLRTPPSPEAAVAAARELGFPIVLKAIAPGLVHKSDAGGVMLDLDDGVAVRAAAETMRTKLPNLTGYIVQQQVPRGVEALVGMTYDASLGPLLVTGLGGTAVELYKDVSFRVTPLTDADAREMLESLRGRALFSGFRGAPPADREALVDVMMRIAALIEIVPELVELALNPVMVLRPGDGAIVVDARMRLQARA